MSSVAYQLRKHLDLSQKEVGDILGISQSGVSKIELKDNASLLTLARIAHHRGKRLFIEISNPDGSKSERIAIPVTPPC